MGMQFWKQLEIQKTQNKRLNLFEKLLLYVFWPQGFENISLFNYLLFCFHSLFQ